MASADRLIELFNEAKARPAGLERERFLTEMCPGEPELKAQTRSLLQAHEGAGDFLKKPISFPTAVVPEMPEGSIGPYRLLQQLGEGGCGIVYLAEQTEPVRRKVALKVIKLGMDTKQVVARFEAERQALALMDHPNIAKIYDAGATDSPLRGGEGAAPVPLTAGRPYFVMELVHGIRITDYCDRHELSTRERLDLFIQVCQAVQHAHQKGIIHRDLKPSNILVTQHDPAGAGCPKVIDFGIAKATSDQPLTDKTVFTAFEQFMGTPAYMSPEQAQLSPVGAGDIDTRTDIYSLGVLLYELLTGNPPFDPEELMRSGVDAMCHTIREKEPVRPSTRLAQKLAAADASRRNSSTGLAIPSEAEVSTDSRRRLRVKETISRLRGDIDWIVMKCLEKDRTRRYETASGLAADLKRHLNNEPVVARPPSRFYEFQKTVHRHKFGFAATAAVLLTLAGGVVMSTWQAVRATRAQRAADLAHEQAEAGRAEAVKARTDEVQLRQRAQAQERAARRRAYASDMNLAQQALAQNNLGRAQELLNRHQPSSLTGRTSSASPGNPGPHGSRPSETDLRGWEWRYLWQQCQSEALFTLCQKSNAIFSLALSPDGRSLAVGEADEGKLSIWDLQKREEITRFPADWGPVFAVFSPRDRLLAFSSGAGRPNQPHRVRLWDGDTQRVSAEFALENPCRGLAFSGDGQTLATLCAGSLMAGREGELALWNVPGGGALARHPAGRVRWNQGHPFAITPDLSAAAYVLWLETISVMDLPTGQERWKRTLSDDYVTALAISPDGRILASAGGFAPSPIRLWDMASGKMMGESSAADSECGYTCSLVFSPDGKSLVSGSSDQAIRWWDIDGLRLKRRLLGHKGEVWSLAVLPDNRTLVSGCKDGSVFVWDMAASRRASSHVRLPEDLMAWSFATNSRTVLTCDRQGGVAQWQGNDWAEERLFEMGTNVAQAFFLPHRSTVLARLTDGNIQVWDLPTRSFSRELNFSLGQPPKCFCIAQGNSLIIVNLANQSLHQVDLTTWQMVRTWQGPVQLWTSALSPDGQWCVTLGRGGASLINDLATGRARRGNLEIKGALGAIFSGDGKLLAAASDHGFARIWDAATLQPVAELRGFLQGVYSVAFSPDSQRLVTSSDGKEAIKFWDVESHEELLTLEGQGSMFNLTAFSPDGAVLGSMNTPGDTQHSVLHLWRAPSWAEIEAAEQAEALPR